jgi:predicted GH43/DUF377 family glycosyl hydrolase
LSLLDLEDPRRYLLRDEEGMRGSEIYFERIGDMGDFVFPRGCTLDRDG